MIWYPCEKGCEPGANSYVYRDNGDTVHTFVSKRVAEWETDTARGEEELYCVECGNCGQRYEISKGLWDEASQETIRKSARRKAGLTRYPYVDPYSGVEVKSKEHREDVWKAHGFHKAEHGINENYDDEDCDRVRSRRQALEAKRAATKRKREDYIRQGIIKPKPRQA